MSTNSKNALLGLLVLLLIIVMGLSFYWLKSKDVKEVEKLHPSSSQEISSTSESSALETEIKTLSVEEQLDDLLKSMTLDEKIGQLFLVRVPEYNQLEDITKYHLGGYLLFSRDVEGETKASLQKKISSYSDTAATPFMIASDEEGGTVTRISRNSSVVPKQFQSPQDLYKSGGMESIINDIEAKAIIFKELGIHTGLSPVADVSVDPDSFIFDRTIGLDVEGTNDYITAVVKASTENQIGSTLKHFPGYGENQDSHTDIVYDNRSFEEIERTSIPPFKTGIEAGVDSILVSHNIVQGIDSNVPASISPQVIGYLREDLSFDGVVMTDDMDMAGLADFITQEEAALAALMAGNDLILSSSYQKQIPVVKEAILTGKYNENELDQSVLRILNWKYKLGIIKLEE